MTRQLVKKSRTDRRKRKGYKGFPWKLLTGLTGGGTGTTFTLDVLANSDKYAKLFQALMGGKHGGRVTKRGIGKATHGFGKVMRKN